MEEVSSGRVREGSQALYLLFLPCSWSSVNCIIWLPQDHLSECWAMPQYNFHFLSGIYGAHRRCTGHLAVLNIFVSWACIWPRIVLNPYSVIWVSQCLFSLGSRCVPAHISHLLPHSWIPWLNLSVFLLPATLLTLSSLTFRCFLVMSRSLSWSFVLLRDSFVGL